VRGVVVIQDDQAASKRVAVTSAFKVAQVTSSYFLRGQALFDVTPVV